MAACAAWMVLGLYIDGWSHTHLDLETFFSPYHAIFYSGYLACAVLTLLVFAKGIRAGRSWRQALPTGYNQSLLGLVLHGAGGLSDMGWHQHFGFEVSSEALISPPHLTIFAGLALIAGAPLRAAWLKPDPAAARRLRDWAPMLTSATILYSTLTFATMILHPIFAPHAMSRRWALWTSDPGPVLGMVRTVGIGSFIVQSAVMAGLLLLLIRRWQLPQGALATVLTTNAALLSLLDDQYWFIPSALFSGWVADRLLARLQPCGRRLWMVRVVAASVPLLTTASYFLTMAATAGVGWSVTMIAGAIVLSALTGLLVSYLVFPPATPSPSVGEPGI